MMNLVTFRVARHGVAAVCFGATLASAAPVDITGGSVGSPVDVTSNVLANQDINFVGGYYVINIPQSGAGIVTVKDVDTRISDFGSTGYSTATNPAIKYTGVISGNGVLTVKSAFNSIKPAYGQPFSGGALIFASPLGVQTWGIVGTSSGADRESALRIDTNATVVFYWPGENDRPTSAGAPPGNAFAGSTTVDRNVTNNGFLFSTTANIWGSITGTGVSSFAYFGGDRGLLGSGSYDTRYSGEAFNTANGLKIESNAIFDNQPDGKSTKLVTRGLTTFSPYSSSNLMDQKYDISARRKVVPVDMFNWGLNIQLWWNGIHQFTGMFLPTVASKNFLETAKSEDAVKGAYFFNGSGMAFGRVINLNNTATLMMGDGREIVTGTDGISTNVWLQGNPFNTLLSTSNFVGSYPGRNAQALAYIYSGTYRINHNLNANVDGKAGVINGIRNGAWVNFLLPDPKTYNPAATQPNHAVLTTAAFLAGVTRIDPNAILQLGDGTVGNLATKTVTFSDGTSYTAPYSDSSGNGMLMTKGNAAMLPKADTAAAGAVYEILNNGTILVNNTVGARDATSAGASAGASPEVAAWVSANRLDGITGSGSLEQRGSLPLTLGATGGNPNTYTGGTLVAPSSTLIVGSATALGSAAAGVSGSGSLVNRGTLKTNGVVRTINVPGNYVQK